MASEVSSLPGMERDGQENLLDHQSITLLNLRFNLFYRTGFHVDEFPDVTVQILEAVLVHEAVVFGLRIRRPTGGDGLANHVVDLYRGSRRTDTPALPCFSWNRKIALGVNSLNLGCVRSMT